MAIYTLPKRPSQAPDSLPAGQPKALKDSPASDLYYVVKAGGSFQVVSKSSGVVQYTAAKKDWAIDWILLNDSKEAA